MSHVNPESEYGRGHRQGEMTQELRNHRKDLDRITNGLDRVNDTLVSLTQQLTAVVQGIARIDQAMIADKETVTQTAAALHDQASITSALDTARWTPFNRAVAAIAALATIVAAVYVFIPHP